MEDEAIKILAKELYGVYWDALGINYHDWDLAESQHAGWLAVAASVLQRQHEINNVKETPMTDAEFRDWLSKNTGGPQSPRFA